MILKYIEHFAGAGDVQLMILNIIIEYDLYPAFTAENHLCYQYRNV